MSVSYNSTVPVTTSKTKLYKNISSLDLLTVASMMKKVFGEDGDDNQHELAMDFNAKNRFTFSIMLLEVRIDTSIWCACLMGDNAL